MKIECFAGSDPVGNLSEKAGMSVQEFSKRRPTTVRLRGDAEDPDPAKFVQFIRRRDRISDHGSAFVSEISGDRTEDLILGAKTT